MSNRILDERTRAAGTATASRALLTAALGGLLCLGAGACSSSTGGQSNAAGSGGTSSSGTGGTGGVPATGGSSGTGGMPGTGGTSGAGGVDSGTGGVGGAIIDSGTYDAPSACDAGVADVPIQTSAEFLDAGMTLDDFTQMCSAKGGAVQIEPECGGHNLCRGFSFDDGTEILSYNTCRGTNDCAGFSCIICN
jgi:hypothetical protein